MSIKTILDPNLSQYFWAQDDTLFCISGSNDLTVLGQSSDVMAFIYGTDNTFSLQNDTNVDITDNGRGLTLIAKSGQNLIVHGFQNDPTGACEITASLYAPVLTPDQHGGTLVSYSSGSIDFMGDPGLSPSQIYWGSTPLPSPSPPPPPPADPTIIVNQPYQTVPLDNATNTTVVLQAVGAMIELSGACNITVDDFTRGMLAHVIFENQGQYAQTVANDGRGGTLVQCGSATVDFAGVVLDPERGQVTFSAGPGARLIEVNSL